MSRKERPLQSYRYAGTPRICGGYHKALILGHGVIFYKTKIKPEKPEGLTYGYTSWHRGKAWNALPDASPLPSLYVA